MTNDPIQVLMHPTLVEPFKQWLAARGLELSPPVYFFPDDLPTYVVSPTDEALQRP